MNLPGGVVYIQKYNISYDCPLKFRARFVLNSTDSHLSSCKFSMSGLLVSKVVFISLISSQYDFSEPCGIVLVANSIGVTFKIGT